MKGKVADLERRFYPITEVRVVQRDEGEIKTIEGHAAVFNKLSEEMYGYRELIKPGAFKKTIKEADVRALFNHDPSFILGRNKSGTLRLKEDDKGLLAEIDPPDTQWARDLIVSVERGDISQMSFGFRVVKEMWDETDEKNIIRELHEVKLFDVSPVTFPAYPDTDVSARNFYGEMGLDVKELDKTMLKVMHGLPLDEDNRAFLEKFSLALSKVEDEKRDKEGKTKEGDALKVSTTPIHESKPGSTYSDSPDGKETQVSTAISTLRKRLDLICK